MNWLLQPFFYIFKGMLGSQSPWRTASTGFLQSWVFLNLFFLEPRYKIANRLPSRETLQVNMVIGTYLRKCLWDAPLGFSEASTCNGWNVNTLDLSHPDPNHLIISLPNLPLPFCLFSILHRHSCVSVCAGGCLANEPGAVGCWICERNQVWPALTKGGFWTGNSCFCIEQWDSFVDMTVGSRGRRDRQGGWGKTVYHEVSK